MALPFVLPSIRSIQSVKGLRKVANTFISNHDHEYTLYMPLSAYFFSKSMFIFESVKRHITTALTFEPYIPIMGSLLLPSIKKYLKYI